MEHKFTHTGIIHRNNQSSYRVRLRQTAKFWISEHTVKFRKDGGLQAGNISYWWKARLMLTSIKEIVDGEEE